MISPDRKPRWAARLFMQAGHDGGEKALPLHHSCHNIRRVVLKSVAITALSHSLSQAHEAAHVHEHIGTDSEHSCHESRETYYYSTLI